MLKSSKLVVCRKKGTLVLLVRRRRDGLWMFPGGKRKLKEKESAKRCLRRELREELPDLRLGPFKIWKRLKGKNELSGRPMSDAVFLAGKATGKLTIGDREIDRAGWRQPWRMRLTPTSRRIRDDLVKSGYLKR